MEYSISIWKATVLSTELFINNPFKVIGLGLADNLVKMIGFYSFPLKDWLMDQVSPDLFIAQAFRPTMTSFL
jgi:hypothetical protein